MKSATAKIGLFEIRDEWLTRGLDEDHIGVLRGVLTERGVLPPLSVVLLDSGALGVVDGNHRYAAHRAEGSKVVPYVIVGRGDAVVGWWLAAANRDHGKNRTGEEKRAAVQRALDAPEGADMNNVDLARHCGVSVDLVRSVREVLRGAPSAAAERRQVLTGEREDDEAASIPERTERRARNRPNVGDPRLAASRPEPPQTDEAPLPFEPEWHPLADACDRVASAIVAVKQQHSAALKAIAGGQEIGELLTKAHGIATRRKPEACPVPACSGGKCPVCGGKGYTLGPVKGWEQIVAAANARGAA